VKAIRAAEDNSKDIALRVLRDGHSAFVAVAVPQGGAADQGLGQENGGMGNPNQDQGSQDNGDQG
jgi:hypothetical protein